MTECSRCGACCDPVLLPFHPHHRAKQRLTGPLEDWERHQYAFYLEHWTVIGEPGEGESQYKVACDQFNPATRECTAHEDRPAICSGFPWYGRDPMRPVSGAVREWLVPQCSFNADVRPMLPLHVVNRGRS